MSIPHFLLPRGAPSPRTLLSLARTPPRTTHPPPTRCASSSSSKKDKPHVLEKPDKFRPPSHPARRVVQTRNGRLVNPGPVNYGPRLSDAEKEKQKQTQYPNMFPPEGTVMYRFLTNRWIHIWIAMVSSSFPSLANPTDQPMVFCGYACTHILDEGYEANARLSRASSPPSQPSPSQRTSNGPRRSRTSCPPGRVF